MATNKTVVDTTIKIRKIVWLCNSCDIYAALADSPAGYCEKCHAEMLAGSDRDE